MYFYCCYYTTKWKSWAIWEEPLLFCCNPAITSGIISNAAAYTSNYYINMPTNYLKTWFLISSLRKRQRSTNKCHCRSICLLIGITCLSQSTFIPHARIGIRSEDIKNVFEKSVKGSGIALSSPRLVIPAAIYALWIISHKYLANDFFDFQVTKDYPYIYFWV